MILVDELAALENKLEEIDISVPDIQVPDVELPPAKLMALLRESPAEDLLAYIDPKRHN